VGFHILPALATMKSFNGDSYIVSLGKVNVSL
jgi:hypothetical protein